MEVSSRQLHVLAALPQGKAH